MPEAVDKEIEAIKIILGALTPLDPDIRTNVLEYILKRLGVSHLASLVDSGPALSSTAQSAIAPVTHIKELKLQKKPRSANEMAALVSYFLANVAPKDQRKPSVSTKDIETYFKIAEFRLPEQIKQTLPNARNAGYFDAIGDGEYRLNAVGHNLVVHSMPRGEESGESRKRPRKSKPSRNAKKPIKKSR